jgi:hypothetical protein
MSRGRPECQFRSGHIRSTDQQKAAQEEITATGASLYWRPGRIGMNMDVEESI